MKRLTKAFLLTFFFSLCAAAVIVTHRLSERVPVPAPRELYSVVNKQLAAFRASDYGRAYRNASSDVQQKFSRQQFESMVRRNYSAMTENHRVEFGLVQTEGATALVQVFFFGEDGSVEAFLYSLVAEDGVWKIEGVEPIQVPRDRQIFPGLHA